MCKGKLLGPMTAVVLDFVVKLSFVRAESDQDFITAESVFSICE